MNGVINIEVYTKKIKFNLFTRSKITFISGNSGTGKTMLCDLIQRADSDSSITIKCDYKVTVLTNLINIKGQLPSYKNHIIFIDQFSTILYKQEFLDEMLNTDARFIIITRDDTYIRKFDSKDIYILQNYGKYINMVEKYKEY